MPLFNIIKYEGDDRTFICKHPCEDFNAFSQLVVHENQEAIFLIMVRRLIPSDRVVILLSRKIFL